VASDSYKSNRDVRLLVLAGVRDVRLEGDVVLGSWEPELKRRFSRPDRQIAQRFVNWGSTPENILHFTRLYGPLCRPEHLHGGKSLEFQQSLQEWRKRQRKLRTGWRGPVLGTYFDMPWVALHVKGKQLWIEVESLQRLIEAEIFLTPLIKRRICARPNCGQPEPYFIAINTRHRFCSDDCVKWSLNQQKKKWWDEHGDQWRKDRSKGSGPNGPRKE